MGKLSKNNIEICYHKIVRLAETSFAQNNYVKSLGYIETAANVAYNFNIIYSDAKLEALLSKISHHIFKDRVKNNPIKNRVVFYDVFGMANRGLTQQYLRALIDLDHEFLYILEKDNSGTPNILKELEGYKKARIVVIDNKLPLLNKIDTVFNVINDYRPQKALLHLHPGSVVAVTVWNAFNNIDRYQVNLTDHAFWLGVNCIDYCLEFRDYGCTVSTEKRGISADKLLMQPYYPILDCETFTGLPNFEKDKIIIFTGGNYYKMYGDNEAFFGILSGIVTQNPKVVIILAGTGNDIPLKNFITKNGFEKSILLIGNRRDINYVFEKADIYLSTYPITGGLMAQFAVSNGKPILSYSSKNIPCNDVDSLLLVDGSAKDKITKNKTEDFFAYTTKLVENKGYRLSEGQSLKNRVIDAKSFARLLNNNLFTPRQINFEIIDIDYIRFMNLYIEVANLFVFDYQKLIIKKFKFKALFLFPRLIFSKWTMLIFSQNLLKKLKVKF